MGIRFAALCMLVLTAGCAGEDAPPLRAPARVEGLLIDPQIAARSPPAPTEHRLGEGNEAENKAARKRWFAELHRAAPDVDWKAIERANGVAEMERRNSLALSGVNLLVANPWSEVGSKNQAGRMMCATLGPDGTKLYAGSALGGVWRANYGGSGWTPLGDNLYGGVSELVVLPGELAGAPDVLVCANSSLGLRVTRDQGQTWETPTGLTGMTSVRELRVLANAQRTILVWAQTNLGGNVPALFVSNDYARTFTKRFQMSTSGNSDAWVPRTGALAASNIFVAHRGQLFRSTDAGFTFAPLATLDASASDATLTGSEAGAPTLYVALSNNGWKLYRSDDAGQSAQQVHVPTDYWSELCASTVNPQVVLYGGVEAFRSTNGGVSFTKLNNWGDYYGDPVNKLHADTMGIYAWPDAQSPSGESVFYCMDGGIWRSTAGGASPLNWGLVGLGVSQYYSTLTSATNPNLVLAGSQDQGYQRGIVQAPLASGPSTNFNQLISGDYGHLTSSDGTHAVVFSNYPGFTLVQEGQTQPALTGYVDFPVGSNHLWLPPVVADPLQATSYFLCAEKLYRFDRTAPGTWTHTFHSSQDFAAGAANYLTALAFAPSDAQRAFAADDVGRLWWSADHGTTWTQSVGNAPNEHYFYGNSLAVHPTNALEAVVAGSGYSTAGVRRTLDGGATWSALTTGLPATMVYDVVYARDGSGDLYAACEAGPYRFDRAAAQWTPISAGRAPITLYWSVEFVGTDLVRFGTYGRGIWDYRIPQPVVAQTYCTAKMNSALCVPSIGFSGAPSTSGTAPFLVTASLVMAQKSGLLFYGYQPHAGAYQGGTMCVRAPIRRLGVQNSGGGVSCTGTYSTDMNALIRAGTDAQLVSGATVYCQYWYRDPADPWNTGLTDALEFQIP